MRQLPAHPHARRVAFEALVRVDEGKSFSNLLVPKLIETAQLSHADSALVTDMVYGTLRWRGLIDPIIASAAKRSLEQIDQELVRVLELGVYQALWMQIADHAVVSSTVALAKELYGKARAGFVNAVMRRIIDKPLQQWQAQVVSQIPKSEPVRRLAVRYSHPEWIVREFAKAWQYAGYDNSESNAVLSDVVLSDALLSDTLQAQLSAILYEDNQPAEVTLARRGNAVTAQEVRDSLPSGAQVRDGCISPYALRVSGVHPAHLALLKRGVVGIEDEGSQCAALAVVHAPVTGLAADKELAAARQDEGAQSGDPQSHSLWLDMCAGPGGKTALIAALAHERGIQVIANEPHAHRAELVRRNIAGLAEGSVSQVMEYDGRIFGEQYPERFTRVLVDAPCSGLGSLRRRPEARWRKQPQDIAELAAVQSALLRSAVNATLPGGVIAYVTCSPAVEETVDIVQALLDDPQYTNRVERLDVRSVIRLFNTDMPLPHRAGDVTLFEHIHHTDQMYICLLRKH